MSPDLRTDARSSRAGTPRRAEVFRDDLLIGVWEAGYRDVWAFALSDKPAVREAVRAAFPAGSWPPPISPQGDTP